MDNILLPPPSEDFRNLSEKLAELQSPMVARLDELANQLAEPQAAEEVGAILTAGQKIAGIIQPLLSKAIEVQAVVETAISSAAKATIEPTQDDSNEELVPKDNPVDIVLRFAKRQGFFKLAELKIHLQKNGVEELPPSAQKFAALFREWQEEITGNLADKGQQFRWVSQKAGTINMYALAEVTKPQPTVEPLPAADSFPPFPAGKSASKSVSQEGTNKSSEELAMLARDLVKSEEAPTRTKDFHAYLATQAGVSLEAAKAACEAAVTSGLLYKQSRQGSVYFSSEPALTTKTPQETNKQSATNEALFNTEELELAVTVLDTLAAPSKHVLQGDTIKGLYHHLKPSVSLQDFRRLLRKLEANRYLVIDSSGNYGKARKSPRVRLRGQDFKDRWKANRNGYINRLENSKAALLR